MINELSILVPVYNDDASRLVRELCRQAGLIPGLRYEVVVFDDGSSDAASVAASVSLGSLPCCRYVRAEHHPCRSAMRNAMSSCALYEWRLMVDARLTPVRPDFLMRYLQSGASCGEAVCGGVCVDGGNDERRLYASNLRFRYEKREERFHSVSFRCSKPYSSFRTTNFFYHRTVLERVPYDESILGYGYEDVMLGKCLRQAGVRVLHIDNPVAYTMFEGNACYLDKVDEALLTLSGLSASLRGYSPLERAAGMLGSVGRRIVAVLFGVAGCRVRASLCGSRPRLWLFKLYKLGRYCSLRSGRSHARPVLL